MKLIITILTLILSYNIYGQTIKEMTPKLGSLINKNTDNEIEFIKHQEKCEALWGKIHDKVDLDNLTIEEQSFLESCSETENSFSNSYWDIMSGACSWYCGGGLDTASASSELKPKKGPKYLAKYSHDLSYKTAWVEGVPGYGIGEYLMYHFPPENPRITKVIIVNGYVKSEKTWRDNSRVKKLKMYIDNKPVAILNLADSRNEQIFEFSPIGTADRKNWNIMKSKPWWTMKFEILDVYKGDKYDDTAITEIYYDGIDVH